MALPAFLPFAISGLGTVANLIRGGVQSGQAQKLEQKFEGLDKSLQPVSPDQYAMLSRYRQLQRAMAMGTDPTSSMARRGLAQGLGQTLTGIAKVGGGPGTISGMLRAYGGYAQGMSQVAGNAFQASQGLMQQEQGLIGDIQNAVYGLQMKRRNLAQLEAVQKRQASTDSVMAAVAGLGQMATMFPKKVAGDVDMNWITKTPQQRTAAMTEQINASLPSGRAMTGEYDQPTILQPRGWGGPSTASELGIQPLR